MLDFDSGDGAQGNIGIGLLGCGRWGVNHARVLSELGVLAGVADTNRTAADQLSSKYRVPVFDLAEMGKSKHIQGLVIATPSHTHASLAEQALLAGKDVLVEKPLALGVEDAARLNALAQSSGRVLMVGHLMRYHPAFMAALDLINEGRLGDLIYIRSSRLNLGRFRSDENVLWSFAPHDFSMILGIMKAFPSRISATGSVHLNAELCDLAMTTLEFDTGQSAYVDNSWLSPYKERKLTVAGRDGFLVFDDLAKWSSALILYPKSVQWSGTTPQLVGATGVPLRVERQEPLVVELKHFLDCIATRNTPLTDSLEGLDVVRMLSDAEASLSVWRQDRRTGIAEATSPIHASVFIDSHVTVGTNTRVWHFSHIMSGSIVGNDCVLGQNVFVGRNVRIGNGVHIQNNVSIYEGVELDDGVFCGPSCTFTNVLNPRSFVDRKDEFRRTRVGRGATLGANSTILCGTEIGEYSLVGAGAVVTRDVLPHSLVIGSPARQVGWVSHAGETLGDDLVCPRTGREYVVAETGLIEKSQ